MKGKATKTYDGVKQKSLIFIVGVVLEADDLYHAGTLVIHPLLLTRWSKNPMCPSPAGFIVHGLLPVWDNDCTSEAICQPEERTIGYGDETSHHPANNSQ